MKTILRLVALVTLLASLAMAQNPSSFTQVNTLQVLWPLWSQTPSVTAASTQVVGNPGLQTYYYWFVAHYTIGATSPFGPFIVGNAPGTLSSGNYIQINPIYPTGSIDEVFSGIDVLRTTSPTPPSGTGNYAVATSVTSGIINDQTNSPSSYTVAAGINGTAFDITCENEATGLGASTLICRQNGVVINFGGSGISAIDATAPVLVNGGATCTASTCTISLTNFSVGGTYTSPSSITLDNFGLVTAITGGSGSPCLAPGTRGGDSLF